MAQEVTVEIDDIHELMYKEMAEGQEGAPELSEWLEEQVEQTLYNAYRQQ